MDANIGAEHDRINSKYLIVTPAKADDPVGRFAATPLGPLAKRADGSSQGNRTSFSPGFPLSRERR
jgi:hypothetical protein